MSMNTENNGESGKMDLSRYSEKTRKAIFYSIVGFLVVVTAVSIFVISPLLSSNKTVEANPEPIPSSSDIGVNPEDTETPEPAPNPTSAEDEVNRNQQDIIDKGENIKPDDHTHTDEDSSVPDSARYVEMARNGVLAYCVIEPGETTEQRKQKMAQWFNPNETTYKNPAEFYYQRTCEIGATSEAVKNDAGQIVVYVGVAWSAVLDAENSDASTGYEQYSVVLDDSGILSLR